MNYAWIPVLLVFVIATGVGGKHFVEVPVTPGTLAQISNYGVILAGNMMPLAALSSDYTAYFHPHVTRFVAFWSGLQSLIYKELAGEFLHTRI